MKLRYFLLIFSCVFANTACANNDDNLNRFSKAGFNSDKQVMFFLKLIKNLAEKGDKESLSDLIHYPIDVKINKETITLIKKDDFIKNYRYIFNEQVLNSIRNQTFEDLSIRFDGVYLGKGEIWLVPFSVPEKETEQVIEIFSINN